MDREDRFVTNEDNNINVLRTRYPSGMHFVVGDTHGQTGTLIKLMEKIKFDPVKDHVYFVGDYNAGGDPRALLSYMSQYYQADYEIPGFHMIRGNHERELGPMYPLDNLPDVIVIRGSCLNYYIAHAGMVSTAFDLINDDMDSNPDQRAYAYKLEDNTCCYNAPLRQLTWSRRGLYSQKSRWHVWPLTDKLIERKACILHGHTPYCFFPKTGFFTYGDDFLFWEKQHVWFAADLCSFNLDSNIKGRYENGESYRGLTCICLDLFDDLASANGGVLTAESVSMAENGLFAVEFERGWPSVSDETIGVILDAKPKMKTIGLDERGEAVIE